MVQLFQNSAQTFRFQQAFKKDRLKIALQVSKLASSHSDALMVLGGGGGGDYPGKRENYRPVDGVQICVVSQYVIYTCQSWRWVS